MQKPLGHHWLVEVTEAPFDILDQVQEIHSLMDMAVQHLNVEVLHTQFHEFSPQGVTGFFLLKESHLSIHTWPEKQYAAIDLFTCGEKMNIQPFITLLKQCFQTQKVEVSYVPRGVITSTSKKGNY